mgnify:FL=1
MAKVVLILEDDYENNSLRISNNLDDLKGQKTTATVLADLLISMIGQSLVSVCYTESNHLNKLEDKEE